MTLAVMGSLVVVFIIMMLLTKSDPSDPLVSSFIKSSDHSYKKNLVETTSRQCNYCESPVSNIRTKHCLRCDRCTLKFDHHCKFVNNCIGEINYKTFLALIVSVEIHEIIIIGIVIGFLVNHEKPYDGYLVFVFLVLVKAITVICFITYLIGFHYFLIKNNLTTFEYVMGKRKKLGYVNPSNNLSNLSDTNLNIQ